MIAFSDAAAPVTAGSSHHEQRAAGSQGSEVALVLHGPGYPQT